MPADAHGCPACPHPGIGPAICGSPNVNVNGRPALRVDDMGAHAACCGPNMWTASAGSSTVFINGKKAHRMNDSTRHCGGSGHLVEGSADVIVGDSGGGGGGGGGAGGGGGGNPSSTASGGGSAANAGGSSGGGAGGGGSPAGGGGATSPTSAPPAPPTHWLEVSMVDDQGQPLAGQRYQVTAPDGTIHTGVLDGDGRARVEGVPSAGSCDITFPDAGDWEDA